MMTGLNVNAGGELNRIGPLRSEQFSFPPVNAVIGGASYGPLANPLPPFRGAIVAGMIGAALVLSGPSAGDVGSFPTIQISVTPAAYLVAGGNMTGVDLRETYEALRREMASEGIPFLNAAELEHEIIERKGTRF